VHDDQVTVAQLWNDIFKALAMGRRIDEFRALHQGPRAVPARSDTRRNALRASSDSGAPAPTVVAAE